MDHIHHNSEMTHFQGSPLFQLATPNHKYSTFKNMSSASIEIDKSEMDEEQDKNDRNNHNIKVTSPLRPFSFQSQEETDIEEEIIRPKANSYSSGYIQTQVPQEAKKSRFNCSVFMESQSNFDSKNTCQSLDSQEIESMRDCQSTDESMNAMPSAFFSSEFAKRRSKFFNNFKTESLKLITTNSSSTQIPSKQDISLPISAQELFTEKFQLLEKIGEGCHSIVRRCYKKNGSPLDIFAVKIIPYKDPEYLFEILSEERVMSLLHHKNIIKYDSFFLEKDTKKAYIVSELAQGRSLAQHVQYRGCMQKDEVRRIAKQLLSGVFYMHSKGIIHRDLSHNNIMYNEETSQVKIIDFTVSKIVTIQKLLSNTGTLHFKSPEMLSGTLYTHAIDIWAIGINLFMLLFGYLPFIDPQENQKTVITNITQNDPFLEIRSKLVQEDPLLLNFLEGLLEKKPLKRMTARSALQHPWIKMKPTKNAWTCENRTKKTTASTAADLDEIVDQGNSQQCIATTLATIPSHSPFGYTFTIKTLTDLN